MIILLVGGQNVFPFDSWRLTLGQEDAQLSLLVKNVPIHSETKNGFRSVQLKFVGFFLLKFKHYVYGARIILLNATKQS